MSLGREETRILFPCEKELIMTQHQSEPSPSEISQEYRVPAIFGLWAEALLDLAALQSGYRVLDVACGTGVVARGAAARVGPSGQVVGLDLEC